MTEGSRGGVAALLTGSLRFSSRDLGDINKACLAVMVRGLLGPCPDRASLPSLRVKPRWCDSRDRLDGTAQSSVSSEVTLLQTLIVSSTSSRLVSSSSSYSTDAMIFIVSLRSSVLQNREYCCQTEGKREICLQTHIAVSSPRHQLQWAKSHW